MRRVSWFLAGVAVWLSLSAGLPGQTQSNRKVLERVAPAYPELARRANLSGLVRIEATVRPNGTVKETRVAGGNPVLCGAAVDAVRKWKFEPLASETTELIELRFQPH